MNSESNESYHRRSRSINVSVLDRLIGIEDPDQLMSEITQDVVTQFHHHKQDNFFYTFSYQPSSSGRYDANPLVAVTDVYSWGFVELIFIMVNHVHIRFQMYQEAHIACIRRDKRPTSTTFR